MADKINTWRAWKRSPKNRLFPLTPFACGQWGKRVRGHVYYFGPLDDPDAALDRWIERKDAILAGRAVEDTSGGITIGILCGAYLDHHNRRFARGKSSAYTVNDTKNASRRFLAAISPTRSVASLTPADFGRAVDHLYKIRKKTGDPLRPRTIKNRIMTIRDMFSWAVKNHLCDPPKYGSQYDPPGLIEIEAEQEENGLNRFFDRDDLLLLIHHAKKPLLVAILLGLNCGFYGEDTKSICLKHLNLTDPIPYHDFRRVKNNRKRKAVLWPETVEAVNQYLAIRKPAVETDRLLLTRFGLPFDPHRRGLNESFNTLCSKAGIKRHGVSVGSLRHTYGTIMDLVPDKKMVNLTMGHVDQSIQARVYSQLNLSELDRLKRVSDVVREWLFYGRIQ